jgi:hypothetical protein
MNDEDFQKQKWRYEQLHLINQFVVANIGLLGGESRLKLFEWWRWWRKNIACLPLLSLFAAAGAAGGQWNGIVNYMLVVNLARNVR